MVRPIIGLLGGLISAAYIIPEDLGTIQKIFLIAPYLGFLHFGVFNGLARNIAFYRVQDQHDKVQRMVNTSFSVARFVSLIGFVVVLFFVGYALNQNASNITIFALFALMLTLTLGPINLHIDTTFRSSQDFGKLATINTKETIIDSVLIVLPVFLGFLGKLIRDGFNVIASFTLRYVNQPIPAKPIFNKYETRELFSVGFPLIIGSYLVGLFSIADQTIIAESLGAKSLGYYTISKMIIFSVPLIPATLSTLLYPKLSEKYGELKNNVHLRKYFWYSLGINIVALVPFCIIAYLSIGPFVEYVLPKYVPGIPAAKINILTCLTLVYIGPSVIMAVTKRTKMPIVIAGIALLLFWFWRFYIGRVESMESVAWMRFYIGVLVSVAMIAYSYYITGLNDFRE